MMKRKEIYDVSKNRKKENNIFVSCHIYDLFHDEQYHSAG